MSKDPDLPAEASAIRPFSGRMIGRTHYFALRIYYEDTDISGIVYHANYLRYCERARSDMLGLLGIDQRAAIEADQGAYAVTELNFRYLRPARLDDDLLVVSTVEEIRAASVAIHQTVIRNDKHTGGEEAGAAQILCKAQIVAAFMSLAGRARRQPQDWRDAFAQFCAPQ